MKVSTRVRSKKKVSKSKSIPVRHTKRIVTEEGLVKLVVGGGIKITSKIDDDYVGVESHATISVPLNVDGEGLLVDRVDSVADQLAEEVNIRVYRDFKSRLQMVKAKLYGDE